jgi:hypothetical protein
VLIIDTVAKDPEAAKKSRRFIAEFLMGLHRTGARASITASGGGRKRLGYELRIINHKLRRAVPSTCFMSDF